LLALYGYLAILPIFTIFFIKVVIFPCISFPFTLKLKTNKRFNFRFIFTFIFKGADHNEDEDLPPPNIAPSTMVTEAVSLQGEDWQ
jgi:hypothetical protein